MDDSDKIGKFYYTKIQNTIQDHSRWNVSLNMPPLYLAELILQLMKGGTIFFKNVCHVCYLILDTCQRRKIQDINNTHYN